MRPKNGAGSGRRSLVLSASFALLVVRGRLDGQVVAELVLLQYAHRAVMFALRFGRARAFPANAARFPYGGAMDYPARPVFRCALVHLLAGAGRTRDARRAFAALTAD